MDAPNMIVTEIWVSAAISAVATKQVVNCPPEKSVNSRVNCESTLKAVAIVNGC
jgi:hypothetical protein